MKLDLKLILKRVIEYCKEMRGELYAIYSEKGIEPFKKPLLFSLPAFLISYFSLYKPSVTSVNNCYGELNALKTLSVYYNDYSSSKQTMSLYRSKLPLYKDKDEWLNFIITSSARKVGVSIDSLSNQNELEMSGFSIVSRDVTVTTTYDIIGKWVAEIENSPIYIKITNFTLKKMESRVGYVNVNFKVTTVFPKPEDS